MKAQTIKDAEKLARMVEISGVLNSTTNLERLLTYIIKVAAELTDAEAASFLLLDSKSRQLYFKASSNELSPKMAETPVPLDSSIAGAILLSNQPMITEDVSQNPRWNPNIDHAIQFRTSSILGVPLHDAGKQAIGVLESLNKQNGRFSEEDVETLAILADLAGVAVEKARLIEELQRANAELSELDQLKSDFIAVASHELRTPLSVILGYVSFLREQADPQTIDQLDNVLQAAVHLRNLIQDMLNFRYVDTGTTNLNPSQVDFVELVRNMTITRDDAAIAKQQVVNVQLPQEQLPVWIDQTVMEVVVSNLLNNAIKFTPKGGQIDIAVDRRGEEAWLMVADNGIGIPPDKLDRIFKRFYQVESALRREYEGMGLGLAIAKELVELHEGRIWAESEVAKGSVFYVALPLIQDLWFSM